MRERVTPELALAVFARDQGCVAPRLGGTYMDCAGRDGLEHVKAEPRMAKRAPSCLCGLVVLCDGHREPGMRAGRVWCTDRENRAAMRAYLQTFAYGPHEPGHLDTNPHDAHVDPCSPECHPSPTGAPASLQDLPGRVEVSESASLSGEVSA